MHSRPTWISHQALTLATVSLSLSHAHTYTHTHTLSLSLSLSLCVCGANAAAYADRVLRSHDQDDGDSDSDPAARPAALRELPDAAPLLLLLHQSVLGAMAFDGAGGAALDWFPRLLAVLGRRGPGASAAAAAFARASRTLPSWLFIRWAPQVRQRRGHTKGKNAG
jgi:hypothetical protein